MGEFRQDAQTVLDEFRQRRPIRAGSLIVSFFGDVVAPRGGSIWLGSLIQILHHMGVSGRLVRTSMYRLVQDGWFDASKRGRKSYYRLTEAGARRFQHATRRIYGRARDNWQGEWLIVLLPATQSAQRDNLRKDLSWMGFGALSPGVLGRPVDENREFEEFLAEHEMSPVAYRARLVGTAAAERLDELVRGSWKLAETERGYQQFVKQYEPVLRSANGQSLPGEQSLLLRVLMIHEYRRVLLRDPRLPATLLPNDWHGRLAYDLCRELYGVLLPDSEDYVSRSLVTECGPLPSPDSGFFKRFGGLRAA